MKGVSKWIRNYSENMFFSKLLCGCASYFYSNRVIMQWGHLHFLPIIVAWECLEWRLLKYYPRLRVDWIARVEYIFFSFSFFCYSSYQALYTWFAGGYSESYGSDSRTSSKIFVVPWDVFTYSIIHLTFGKAVFFPNCLLKGSISSYRS